MGTAAPQLKVHIEAGLNVGLSQDENGGSYANGGVRRFPAALNALFIAKEVFGERSG
jgi:4-carboxymuconolactone decarboxylase